MRFSRSCWRSPRIPLGSSWLLRCISALVVVRQARVWEMRDRMLDDADVDLNSDSLSSVALSVVMRGVW